MYGINIENFTNEQRKQLLNVLKSRFEKNKIRHKDFDWEKIQLKLEQNPEKLLSLYRITHQEVSGLC